MAETSIFLFSEFKVLLIKCRGTEQNIALALL